MGETYTEVWGCWTIKVCMFVNGIWRYQASTGNFINASTIHAANRTDAVRKVKEMLGGSHV